MAKEYIYIWLYILIVKLTLCLPIVFFVIEKLRLHVIDNCATYTTAKIMLTTECEELK